jgi:hypothetical protein
MNEERRVRYVPEDKYWIVKLGLYIGYFGLLLALFSFSMIVSYTFFYG